MTRLRTFCITLWRAICSRLRELRSGLPAAVPVAVDVTMQHTPELSEDDRRFARQLRRLYQVRSAGDALRTHQIDYWALRYNRLGIAARAEVSFRVYLQRPELVEAIARDFDRAPSTAA